MGQGGIFPNHLDTICGKTYGIQEGTLDARPASVGTMVSLHGGGKGSPCVACCVRAWDCMPRCKQRGRKMATNSVEQN